MRCDIFSRCREHTLSSLTQALGQKLVEGWQVRGLELEAPC